jgi:hypothetical protein
VSVHLLLGVSNTQECPSTASVIILSLCIRTFLWSVCVHVFDRNTLGGLEFVISIVIDFT